MEPTDDKVDGRDKVDGVSGTEDVIVSDSRLLWGWY